MRVCLLASGSKGNAVYIETRENRILIDSGLPARELQRRLALIGASGEDLSAVLVSHEHGDHCRGLGPVSRRFRLPVYLHPETLRALPHVGTLCEVREIEAGEPISLRDVEIRAFPVTHDAAAPMGYIIETSEGKIGIATDLGVPTRLVTDCLKGCRTLILESNHDEDMLRDGPYPWHLKQRIRSHHGHLSNEASARLLKEVLWEGLEAVFLAHLSETNNTPALAESCARAVLSVQNICSPQLILGCQDENSACFAV